MQFERWSYLEKSLFLITVIISYHIIMIVSMCFVILWPTGMDIYKRDVCDRIEEIRLWHAFIAGNFQHSTYRQHFVRETGT
jgi:hypothetical protein